MLLKQFFVLFKIAKQHDSEMLTDNMYLEQVVYAKTDITAGSKGITAFIIEKGMPG